MLDFRMDTFLAVCREMNFTRAAESLGLTQPAVSQHIRFLEEEYDAPLFIRDKKKLILTPAGEVLRSALETMRSDEHTLKERIKNSLIEQKTLTFGVTMTIGEYAIVPALSRLIKDYPDINFHVRYGNTQTLLADLKEGRLDFAVVEGYFKADAYDTYIYRSEAYLPVAAAGHQFKHPIHFLKDLTGERLLTREAGSGTRAILSKTLALKNMSIQDFQSVVEIENIHTIVELLALDCGISFLYQAAVQKELDRGILVPIPLEDFMVMHDFTFVWNKGSVFSEDYQKFFRILKKLQ